MTKKESIFSFFRSMPASSIFFILFFLFKPLYIFQSGAIQPGDLFLVLSFSLYVIEGKSLIPKTDRLFALFLALVIVINGIYYSIYGHSQFVMTCLYYVFNYFVIVVFRDSMHRTSFQNALSVTCKVNLIVQLLFYVLHIGSYWEGTYRYMGSYNDPNQLGFAIISTLCILRLLNAKQWYIYATISLLLIMKSYSSGMLATFVLLVTADLIFNFQIAKNQRYSRIQIITLWFVISSVLIYALINTQSSLPDFSGFRIEGKLSSSNSILESFISDRNLKIAVEHPEFFLFGYGEAVNFRRYGHGSEMHSTWLSLWFCYGLFPFLILLRWIHGNIKNLEIKYIAVYIAIFLEAFTLVNHRQPSFWMIILLGNLCKKTDYYERKELNFEQNEN